MAEEAKRCTGIVKWFSGQKGFGFIAPDDGGEDLFVHQTEIRSEGFRTLREGKRVEFVVNLSEDGRSKAGDVVGLAGSFRSGGGRGGGRRSFDDDRAGGFGRGRRRGGRYDGGDGGGNGGGAGCYNCGEIGHLARNCYGVGDGSGSRNVRYGGDGGGNRGYSGRRRGGGGGRARGRGGGRECYNCGEEGHFARDCVND